MIKHGGVMILGTRLGSEALIKKHYPHLRYVRIHTAGKHAVVIYAWNEDLVLPDRDSASLKRFAAGYLPPYVCYEVKAYYMIQTDRVPPAPELPDAVVQVAMSGSLDQQAIVGLINGMFSGGSMTFDRYDERTGTIHFTVFSNEALTNIEKDLIHQYLHEIIPIGSYSEVAYI